MLLSHVARPRALSSARHRHTCVRSVRSLLGLRRSSTRSQGSYSTAAEQTATAQQLIRIVSESFSSNALPGATLLIAGEAAFSAYGCLHAQRLPGSEDALDRASSSTDMCA